MTTQPNTEPLKVGEECREAFEQWMIEYFGFTPTKDKYGEYTSQRVYDRWEGWQAAWNRRASPSPAEVGSDNCQICNGKRGGVLGNENIEDGVVICDYCHSDRMKFRALSQQSTARVEGEAVTTDSINRLAVVLGVSYATAKETIDTVFECVSGSSAVGIVDRDMPQGFRWLERHASIPPNGTLLFTHSVSDDQQAKDAARYRWLRDVHEGKSITMHTPIGHRMEITVNCGSGALVFKPSENLDFQRTLDAAIDAALSTTKQEESK